MLFGSSYAEAILLSRLTVWITAVSSLSAMLSQYVISSGKTRVIAVIQTVGLFITVLTALMLIPLYSSRGLLLAQTLAAIYTLLAYIKPALSDLERADRQPLSLLIGLSLSLVALTFVLPMLIENAKLKLGVSLLVIGVTAALSVSRAFTVKEKKLVITKIKAILHGLP
jgi:O-antigen/teichoic acid export membrane protein